MCGRYYVDDEMVQKIERIIGQIEWKMTRRGRWDVHPSETADILTKGRRFEMKKMEWGIPMRGRKGLLINARAETALDKPVFGELVKRHRCIIPAMGFYEWNTHKEKAEFFRNDRRVIYMAGFFEPFGEKERFVILTTKANASVAPVHGRMPLILEDGEIESWIYREESVKKLLEKEPVALGRRQAYEQQTLFLD